MAHKTYVGARHGRSLYKVSQEESHKAAGYYVLKMHVEWTEVKG